MSHGFVCVGGPHDGKWMPQQPGQDRLKVAIWPEPMTCAFSVEGAALPVDLVVEHRWYVLQEHHVHGAAWVFQD